MPPFLLPHHLNRPNRPQFRLAPSFHASRSSPLSPSTSPLPRLTPLLHSRSKLTFSSHRASCLLPPVKISPRDASMTVRVAWTKMDRRTRHRTCRCPKKEVRCCPSAFQLKGSIRYSIIYVSCYFSFLLPLPHILWLPLLTPISISCLLPSLSSYINPIP
jgi:hypothetical protein